MKLINAERAIKIFFQQRVLGFLFTVLFAKHTAANMQLAYAVSKLTKIFANA